MNLVDVFGLRSKQSGISRPVGGSPIVVRSSATKIVEDKSAEGMYIFGDECPMDHAYRSRPIDRFEEAIFRFEIKIDKEQNLVRAGSALVVSQIPYSCFWSSSAIFKSRSKMTSTDIAKYATKDDLLKLVNSHATDPFESRKNFLTAAIESTEFSKHLSPAARTVYANHSHSFGLIPNHGNSLVDVNKIEEKIYSSKILQNYLARVRNGKPIGFNKSLRVPDSIKDDLDSLLFWSVRQALAGPGGDAKTLAEYKGEPVAILARNIFLRHCETLTKRTLVQSNSSSLPPIDAWVDIDALDEYRGAEQRLQRFLSNIKATDN